VKRSKLLSNLVLGFSLLFTLVIFAVFLDFESRTESILFEKNIQSITHLFSERLGQYERVLVGAKGLFAASYNIEFEEWKNFVEIQRIDSKFPGIQGVGYVRHITHDEREDLIDELKRYGLSNYEITPEGDRDEYYPVVFLEPQDFRNKRAMGYDIYVEKTRSDAVNLVRDTGQTTLTGKITLVQETETDVQNGFLMLVPIYSNDQSNLNMFPDLQGMVLAVFRMNDFSNGILDPESFQFIHMKIYDGVLLEDNLLFDSDDISPYRNDRVDFSETITVNAHNRDWIFVYEGMRHPSVGLEQAALFLIPIVGVSMSFLLFYILRLFARNLKLSHDAVQTEKISSIGTMASRMAHDLRNPLTVINLSFEMLQKDLAKHMDDKMKSRANVLQSGITEMNRIIGDVLDFVRTSELRITSNSVSEILRNTISHMVIPDTVDVILPGNDAVISCDSRQMEAVFSNLIVNAIQSMNNFGEIRITLATSTKSVSIMFADSGPGIQKDALPRIFDPLFTTKSKGTGLGLVICKSIVEQHHGTISVRNNPTTFTIELPKR